MDAFTVDVMVTGTITSSIPARKSFLVLPPCFINDKRIIYMSSTPRPSIINGRVHAMLMFTLIPSKIPNPTAAKKDNITRVIPARVIPILDLTVSKLKRNITEISTIITIDIKVSLPLLNVISSSNLSFVPFAGPIESKYPENITSPEFSSSQFAVQISSKRSFQVVKIALASSSEISIAPPGRLQFETRLTIFSGTLAIYNVCMTSTDVRGFSELYSPIFGFVPPRSTLGAIEPAEAPSSK
mmetsp:Transcript_26716/g.30835  ORF Transcript_26716/g.30835 Transcript_26716/m.30835 type:complete len:242 (+) Transcript_26716:2196-2921(+)